MDKNINKSVSALITVYNKGNIIGKTLESVASQPIKFREIVVVDDGSSDNSPAIIKEFAAKYKNVKAVFQKNQGVAKALNAGLKLATGDFIAVIDGDVILEENWILKMMPYFSAQGGSASGGDGKEVGAAAGLTKLGNKNNLWSALAGYNVEYRQSNISQESVDHLSTTNTIYRKSVLDKLDLFDGKFTYGQDNEISYRILEAGYKLILSKKTFCLHFWPESFKGFMKERSHGAWARMMLIKKHPERWSGDKVSNLRYFFELPLGMLFFFFIFVSLVFSPVLILAVIVLLLIYPFQFGEIEFFMKNKKIFIGLFLPFFVLLRSAAWINGIARFCLDKLFARI